jgi:hypothetical protein
MTWQRLIDAVAALAVEPGERSESVARADLDPVVHGRIERVRVARAERRRQARGDG